MSGITHTHPVNLKNPSNEICVFDVKYFSQKKNLKCISEYFFSQIIVILEL